MRSTLICLEKLVNDWEIKSVFIFSNVVHKISQFYRYCEPSLSHCNPSSNFDFPLHITKRESIHYTRAWGSIWFWTNLLGTINALLIYKNVPVKCYLASMVTRDRCLTAPAVDPWHSFAVPAVWRPCWSKQIAVSPSLGELFHSQPSLLRDPADRRHTYPHRCTLIAPALIFHCIHTRCNEAGVPSVPVWSLGSSSLARMKHREPVSLARPGNPSWSIFNVRFGIVRTYC